MTGLFSLTYSLNKTSTEVKEVIRYFVLTSAISSISFPQITSWDQIGYKVAGMTVGSAASVTLIGGGHAEDWGLKVTRIHDSSQVALCMINESSTTRHLGLDAVIPQEIKVSGTAGTAGICADWSLA